MRAQVAAVQKQASELHCCCSLGHCCLNSGQLPALGRQAQAEAQAVDLELDYFDDRKRGSGQSQRQQAQRWTSAWPVGDWRSSTGQAEGGCYDLMCRGARARVRLEEGEESRCCWPNHFIGCGRRWLGFVGPDQKQERGKLSEITCLIGSKCPFPRCAR